MKKRIIQRKSCFALGIAGAACGLAAGLLMMLAIGPASLLHMAAFVLSGAMLLFLATTEKDENKKTRRLKLLLLFLALLVSYFNLPLLCPPLEAIVLPLLALLYKQKGDGLPLIVVCVFEVAYMVARTLSITSLFGNNAIRFVGVALIAVSLARGWLLTRFYLAAAKLPPQKKEDAVVQLK